MIIDFHTHTFPDKIAGYAVASLKQSGCSKNYTDGTNGNLQESMKKAGVDLSVVLPVVTNPVKTSSINDAAVEINLHTEETGILSLGGAHPEMEGVKEEIRRIARMGIKGIKLHPDYYRTKFNDIRMKRIMEAAEEEGLIIVTHSGLDIGLYPPICCGVEEVLDVMRDVRPTKLVLAHMGGWMDWERVTEKLADQPVFIDTAFSLGEINWIDPAVTKPIGGEPFHMMKDEQFVKMVKAFGSEKILFATDSPWADQSEYVRRISEMPITAEEKENIFWRNAKKLLNL